MKGGKKESEDERRREERRKERKVEKEGRKDTYVNKVINLREFCLSFKF